MPATIKALTVREPWATAIAIKAKAYETRSWKTDYRGKLVIHAGKLWGREQAHSLAKLSNLNPKLRAVADDIPSRLGRVLCVGQLIHCYEITRRFRDIILDREQAFGDWTLGRFAWQLQVTYVFNPPIPAVGKLGLWEWTPPLELDGVNLSPPSRWMQVLGLEWEDDQNA
jgi:hypothetical protein